jgi:hypothetical protein
VHSGVCPYWKMEVIFEMYRHIGSKVFSRAHFKYVRWITFDFDFAAGNLQGGCSEDISARRKSLLCKSLSIRFYYNLMCVCVWIHENCCFTKRWRRRSWISKLRPPFLLVLVLLGVLTEVSEEGGGRRLCGDLHKMQMVL